MKMKKGNGKKLLLSLETLHNLSKSELQGAAGGVPTLGDSCHFCDSSQPDCGLQTRLSDCRCISTAC